MDDRDCIYYIDRNGGRRKIDFHAFCYNSIGGVVQFERYRIQDYSKRACGPSSHRVVGFVSGIPTRAPRRGKGLDMWLVEEA